VDGEVRPSHVGYASEIGVVEGLVLNVIRAAGATRRRRLDGQLDGSRRVTFGPSVSIERCNLPGDARRGFIRVSVVETRGCRVTRSSEHISASAHLTDHPPTIVTFGTVKEDTPTVRLLSTQALCLPR
jgi:hypothetical protein